MRKTEITGGIVCLIVLLSMILIYQKIYWIQPVEEPVVEEEEAGDTADGFDEAEEAIQYLLAQIEACDVESALRICAIHDIANYFNMPLYLEYTEAYKGIDMIPACEDDGDGYSVISEIRLASDFGENIQKCIENLSSRHLMEVYEIINNEPENPDGKYYQRLRQICDILGARDVAEYTVYLKVDEMPMELHLSMVKYRGGWKLLQFADLELDPEKPCIYTSRRVFAGEPLELTDYRELKMPMNYYLINENPTGDIDQLLKNFCMYLQRGDVLSALACYSYDGKGDTSEFSLELLQRQKEAAIQLQTFFYQMFLNDADYAWAGRHYSDSPEYLPELARLPNMQYVDFYNIRRLQNTDRETQYMISYSYDNHDFESMVTVSEEKGLILRLEQQ